MREQGERLMLSRFSAGVCASILGALLPGANACAQETPDVDGLFPTQEESAQEFIQFGNSVAINGRTALVSIPTWLRIALYEKDENGTWARTGSIGEGVSAMAIHGKRLALAQSD